jgi:SAM-dependent methyltransferase
MMKNIDEDDLYFFQQNAALMREQSSEFAHLDHEITIANYIRIANDITAQMRTRESPQAGSNFSTECHILDWGCGFGQMSYLLKRRGASVISFDLGSDDTTLPPMPLTSNLEVVRTSHPTLLPFDDRSFDAVPSCGVLEHVDECSGVPGNERKSLGEIARVLRAGGRFFIYQLPQQLAWQEALVRQFKLGYSHPRRYTAHEIRTQLSEAGFRVIKLRRANLVPRNLTGMPESLRRVYSRFRTPLTIADRLLCRIPVLNRIAGALEITAVKM